jgi:hypothetical protein
MKGDEGGKERVGVSGMDAAEFCTGDRGSCRRAAESQRDDTQIVFEAEVSPVAPTYLLFYLRSFTSPVPRSSHYLTLYSTGTPMT